MTSAGWTTPFRGLAPFGDGPRDAELFFGRESDTQIVVANLLGARLTVLYGPSGVGKSSLLRAGVVRSISTLARTQPVAVAVCASWSGNIAAAVEEAARRAVAATLGGDPGDAEGTLGERLDTWTAALGGELCLIFDQFEEAFTARRADELGPLLAELAGRPGPRVNVLLAVRDDALAELDAFKPLLPGLFSNTLRLDHLTRDAARMAILGPIEAWNLSLAEDDAVTIDAELVETVLDEVSVAGDRVETTYLQLVMQRLWEYERDAGSSRLRRSTLGALGGSVRIVGDHLQRALDELDGDEQDLAAGMFAQLVTPSGRKIAHRVNDLAELQGASASRVRTVLEALAAQRIVRPVGEDDDEGGGRYEIYHDVLADPIAAWCTARRSERARDEERALAHARHRRLLVLTVIALAAVGVLSALTAYAFAERRAARHDARAARSGEAAATALTQLGVDPELALALATEGATLSPSDRVDSALREVLLAEKLRRVGPRGPVAYAAFHTGAEITTASPGRLSVLDERLRPATSRTIAGRAVAASGDDVVVLAGNRIDLVRPRSGATARSIALHRGASLPVRNVLTGRIVGQIRVPRRVALVALGPRRTLLAESGGVRTVLLDVQNREARYTLPQPSRVTALAFGPGARTLATGGADGSTRVWQVSTGRTRVVLEGRGAVTTIAFSPRATLVATAGHDGVGRVWRSSDGAPVSVLSGHTSPITDMAFSPDGASIATASSDGTVRIWKALTGQPLEVLRTARTSVTAVVFTRDSASVIGAGADGRTRMWEARAQPTLARYRDFRTPIERARWTRGGLTASTSSGPHFVAVASAPRASSTGRVSVTAHGRIAVLQTAAGRRVLLRGHTGRITSARVSADDTRVVTASRDGTARIWDASDGRVVSTLRHFAAVADAEFSPDGRWVVTAGPSTAAVWDAETGRRLFDLRGHEAPLVFASFDASGERIYTASLDGTIRRYTCAVCSTGDALVRHAHMRLAEIGRMLTEEERHRYLGAGG